MPLFNCRNNNNINPNFSQQPSRRVRSSVLRQDGPVAASKASRRLRDQKENIKTSERGNRTAASTSASSKSNSASPPKSSRLATSSSTSAAKTGETTKVKTTTTTTTTINGDARSSKLPKSVSNNSMKASSSNVNKSEIAGKTKRDGKIHETDRKMDGQNDRDC